MCDQRIRTAAFTGHRSYLDADSELLLTTIRELHARGIRVFLSGMAVGFDLAAAEAVLACRSSMPGLQLVAVIPFEGQQARFCAADRMRYDRVRDAADRVVVLSPDFHSGCYAQRNDYLVNHAGMLVAWYDGSLGGTHYTVRRAMQTRLTIVNLHPAAPQSDPELF